MPSGVEEFIERVVQSGLMSMRDIAEFHRGLSGDKRTDPEQFAKELVKTRKLTKFQASAIYQGKTQGLVFGDYLVLDKIGVGGMGKVFKARHRASGDVVALKVMSSTAMKSAKAVRRFQQETEVAQRLRHPNIVATYSSGELEGLHYLIMQYIDGENLRAEVKNRGQIPQSEIIDWMLQVAKGLEYAHREGAVHRDIKPSNLLLDKSGMVMILDMGLARIEDPDDDDDAGRLTQQGQMLGTAEYMSPEQVEDPRLANAASDVYSLGCTMYYLLTGSPPFRGNSVPETLIMHAREAIPKLRTRRPDCTPELEAVYERMLAKRSTQRYQSMTEVIAALEAVKANRPPPAATVEFTGENHPQGPENARPPSSDSFSLPRDSAVIEPPAVPRTREKEKVREVQDQRDVSMTTRDVSLERNVSLPGISSGKDPNPMAGYVPHEYTQNIIASQRRMTWLLVALVGIVAILLVIIVVMIMKMPQTPPPAATKKDASRTSAAWTSNVRHPRV